MRAHGTIERPIVVLGAPRSGTTLLLSMVSSHPAVWSLYSESEELIARSLGNPPKNRPGGHAVSAGAATPDVSQRLRGLFYRHAINHQVWARTRYSRVFHNRWVDAARTQCHRRLINPVSKPPSIRLVEKTPRNCLRVGFMNRVFPDALWIFLTRHPAGNVSSLLDGWRGSKRFTTYVPEEGIQLDGYDGAAWKFLMPPGWQGYLRDKSLAEVCAFQYLSANQGVLDGLADLPAERSMQVRYEKLVEDPTAVGREVCRFAGLPFEGAMESFCRDLPVVNAATQPDADKWMKNESEIMTVQAVLAPMAEQLGYSL